MEGNNDIFLADGDALGYLAGPMDKKFINLVRADLMTNFSILPKSPLCAHVRI